MDKSLDGTALIGLIRQISAMPGTTHEERCEQYATLLRSRGTKIPGYLGREYDKLEFFVRGLAALERNSFLVKPQSEQLQVAA
ncbi:MAG TPA: hypothetical protein VN086_00445 [Candidatus Paceibacterota bacterium]|nr:hypothetical protein [Candidatus Paceibacterota bacterium]